VREGSAVRFRKQSDFSTHPLSPLHSSIDRITEVKLIKPYLWGLCTRIIRFSSVASVASNVPSQECGIRFALSVRRAAFGICKGVKSGTNVAGQESISVGYFQSSLRDSTNLFSVHPGMNPGAIIIRSLRDLYRFIGFHEKVSPGKAVLPTSILCQTLFGGWDI
jgi:hypothetical protein